MRARPLIAILGMATMLVLAGCTSTDKLATNYGDGGGTVYSDDSGLPVIVPVDKRAKAIDFTEKDEDGNAITLSDLRGQVVVVNFWYAGCAPCRAEAPILDKLYTTYSEKGVSFLGVNTVDQGATAKTFETAYKVKYPSVMDVDTGAARIAFVGAVPPTATPTTYVIDRKGRVAARLVGALQSTSILNTLISDALAEKS